MQHEILSWRDWNELNRDDLYAMLRLRQRVLIVEQNSPYEDLDGFDQISHHLLAHIEDTLIGYVRAYVCGSPARTTFGRLVVAPECRGRGIARHMVDETLQLFRDHYKQLPVSIEAQSYLQPFYQTFGFKKVGIPYDDCGVEHVRMDLR